MKKITALVLLTGLAHVSLAQAHEGVYKTKKMEQPAIVATYNFPQNVVKSALLAKMTDKRLKGEDKRGVLKYTNASISEISSTPLDYTFIIEESGKTNSPTSLVYMIMEGANATAGDGAGYASNGKAFLDNLVPDVERTNNVFAIKRQEEKLLDEENALLKIKAARKKLEEKLKDNDDDQQKQQKAIDAQRKILDELKARLN